ncbi:MAG: hypothetical protein DRJ39_04485 [Thermoprotei archaeon]|nr:MAG: hypothetical protein DRJ39_04485 [Thermoprotei archaeon]
MAVSKLKLVETKKYGESECFKEQIIRKILLVSKVLLNSVHSRQFSIKLKTLIRYGYIAYVRNTTDINTLKGLMSRIYPPREIVNQHYYRAVEKALRNNFNVKFTRYGSHKYAVFVK